MFKKINDSKKFISVLFLDIIISLLSTYFAYSLRLESYHIPNVSELYSYVICIIIFIPIFLYFKVYDSIIRYTNIHAITNIGFASLTYCCFIFMTFSLVQQIIEIPRSIAIIQPIIFYFMLCLYRISIALQRGPDKNNNIPNLVIYGAGTAGSQLLDSIQNNNTYNVVAFIDKDIEKNKKSISGIKIYSENSLERLIKEHSINDIIVAIPSMKLSERRSLVNRLKVYNINTRILPDIKDLINNNISVNDIRNLNVDDLLEREIKKENIISTNLLLDKIVLLTGAGGSIGSELCKQIIYKAPKEIILLEHSEYNLYKIEEDLNNIILQKKIKQIPEITPILLSINNYEGLDHLFSEKKPNIVFHAAAYKHVNLVETNIFESIRNNFLGTLNIAKLAFKYEVSSVLLISSDKAVRPTNIMGATKRMSELVFQAYADKSLKSNQSSIYSIVRFGNVLASSGSVINKFRTQIKNRDPVTVTHEDVTRYFMTISEAVHLILQAFSISRGGEVFLLDMGKPVKIIDLAKKMIKLSGLSIKNLLNPDGDIEIKIIGLRPGEKLYEELLIDNNSIPSINSSIFYAKEKFLAIEKLESISELLIKNISNNNLQNTIDLLENYVDGFNYDA